MPCSVVHMYSQRRKKVVQILSYSHRRRTVVVSLFLYSQRRDVVQVITCIYSQWRKSFMQVLNYRQIGNLQPVKEKCFASHLFIATRGRVLCKSFYTVSGGRVFCKSFFTAGGGRRLFNSFFTAQTEECCASPFFFTAKRGSVSCKSSFTGPLYSHRRRLLCRSYVTATASLSSFLCFLSPAFLAFSWHSCLLSSFVFLLVLVFFSSIIVIPQALLTCCHW